MTQEASDKAKQLFDAELNAAAHKALDWWRALHSKPKGLKRLKSALRFNGGLSPALKELMEILKGGAGSGNWGHAGRPGKRGGSVAHSSGRSMVTGRDASRRQQEARAQAGYFKGNIRTATVKEMYEGSSDRVKQLASETGILATDDRSFAYIEANKAKLSTSSKVATLEDVDRASKKLFDDMASGATSWTKGAADYDYDKHLAKLGLAAKTPPITALDLYRTTRRRSVTADTSDAVHNAFKASLTPQEITLLDNLSKYELKTKGWHGVNMYRALDKLSAADHDALNKLQAKAVYFSNVGAVSRRLEWSMKLSWDADRSVVAKALSDSFGKSPPSIGVETPGQFLERTLKSDTFRNAMPTTSSTVNLNNLIALSSTSAKERNDLIGGVNASWDKSAHGHFRAQVKSTFYVKASDEQTKRFDAAARKYGNVSSGYYHGTSPGAAKGINVSGFRASSSGMMGSGVYLADKSSKSAQYLAGGAGSFTRSSGVNGVLLTADAAMGKVGDFSSTTSSVERSPYDTLYGKKGGYASLKNDEWVVQNADAVIPRYWMEVEIN